MDLTPSLWRTCRVIANPARQRCLKAVLKHPGLSVSALARETRLAVPVASQYLRDLQARGLVSVTRRSRWTCYDGRPDSAVKHAAPLLAALSEALQDKSLSPKDTQRILQGFTHPRRLTILRLLACSGPLAGADIVRATGISKPATTRHLEKLERCGLVRQVNGRRTLAGSLPRLAQCILLEIGP